MLCECYAAVVDVFVKSRVDNTGVPVPVISAVLNASTEENSISGWWRLLRRLGGIIGTGFTGAGI